ncbi:MAG: SDR family NAD(P)-dependent oxidoreductase [Candidatus Lokiarchaeota archaeon]|nr:SDR family NAD(P)-dependent oxidoreductase [Candidatus Lokiarchaeota archaeon]
MKKCVLITGASTGIGRSTAEYLAAQGFLVYAGARKEQDLIALNEINNIMSIKLDITSPKEIASLKKFIEDEGNGLFAVFNNAGIAIAGPLMDISVEEIERQFQTNLFGLHRVTRAVFPHILEAKGRIIMMSSDSEFFATPFFGPYCSSKHALGGYSDSLRRELLLYGVKVVKIQAGRVNTKIWDKGRDMIPKYKNSLFSDEATKIGEHAIHKGKTTGLDPIEVAKLIYKVLTIENPKASYLIAPSTLKYRIIKVLSERKIDKMVKKELQKYKKN